MAWLTSYRDMLLRQAGFPTSAPLAEAAIEYAEQTIERYTGRVWTALTPFEANVRLSARSYILPLPPGVTSVSAINGQPAQPGTSWRINALGLEVDSASQAVVWQPGFYLIAGMRGSTDVSQSVLKAAALLVGYYLRLSDPERSRFQNYSRGDFTGEMRMSQLPVPEAEVLLSPLVSKVRVGVT